MDPLATVHVSGRTIAFGIAEHEAERQAVRAQRVRVYIREGYYPRDVTPEEDYDRHDEAAVYFVAQDGEQLVGSARLVRGRDGLPFPIETVFRLDRRGLTGGVPVPRCAEIGKLVAEAGIANLSRVLTTTIGLIQAILQYSAVHGLERGLSFIKSRLLHRLTALGLPLRCVPEASLIYPRTGLLRGYVYEHADPVLPVVYVRNEMAAVLHALPKRKTSAPS